MKLKSVEKLENSRVQLEIQVEKEEFETAMNQSYKKNVSKINVPGFRKGKAPRKVIERMYGETVFSDDAVNIAYPSAFEGAVKESGIEPVDTADVEMVDFNIDGFTFKATVTVKPEVTLGEYKGLTADKLEVSVTEQDITDELNRLTERNSRLISVERAAKDGDTVIIDFEGFVDNVPFEGGKAEGHNLKLGSSQFIPGFEEQLIGCKAGNEVDVNVTFPKEYHSEDLAGKDAVFHVKINEIKETEFPAIDDEFAKDVSEFDTLDELKKSIETKISDSRKKDSDNAFENAILNQIVDSLQVEIPEVMVETQLDKICDDFSNRLAPQGMTLDQYLEMTQTDKESFRKNFHDSALHQVKTTLALEAISHAENIELSDSDIDAEYTKLSEQFGMPVDRVKSYIPAEAMKNDMLSMKAAQFVRENSVANMVNPEELAKETAKKAKSAENDTAKADDTGAESAEKAPKKRATKKKTDAE